MKFYINKFKRLLCDKTLLVPKVLSKSVWKIQRTFDTSVRVMLHFYPVKNSSHFVAHHSSQLAICVQGPCLDPHQVEENLATYKNRFPSAYIVYATSNPNFATKSADVIHLDEPSVKGYGNFNNQRQCCIAALSAASKRGCDSALKVRDDIDVLLPEAISYLDCLARVFPNRYGKPRVFFSSLHSRLHIPFHVCDFVQYGRTQDLLEVWGNTRFQEYQVDRRTYVLEHYQNTDRYLLNNVELRPHVELGLAAAYCFLGSRPCKRSAVDKAWWQLISDHIGFFDLEDLGIFCDRHTATLYFERSLENPTYFQIRTALWMSLLECGNSGLDLGSVFLKEVGDFY